MNQLSILLTAALCQGSSAYGAELTPGPLTDPIPQKIQKGSVLAVAGGFVRFPRCEDSAHPPQTNEAYVRLQYLMPVPDYAQPGNPGYGKFNTAYSASSDSGIAAYLDDTSESHESEIQEWSVDNHSADRFTGTSKEIFRVGQFVQNHNIGSLAFNYSAERGSEDYGMLYASFGDGGGANDPNENGQSLATPMSTIIRIDPLGGNEDAAYGIPADNPFLNRPGVSPEIWTYGLRHAQYFSFDRDGTMYIADIGQNQIEEINIGVAGANYVWRLQEGTFATAFGIGGARPNPANILELRVLIDGLAQDLAGAIGFSNTYARGNRAGIRLGTDSRGQLYLLSKGDGWVRRLRTVTH